MTRKPRITSNNQHAIRQLALAGVGLSFHVVPEITEELADGRLVRVLRHWSTSPLSVDALMPPRTTQPAKVRATIEALLRYLSNLKPASGTGTAPGRKKTARARV